MSVKLIRVSDDDGLVSTQELRKGQLAEIVDSPEPRHIGVVGQVYGPGRTFVQIGGMWHWGEGNGLKLRILPNESKLEVGDNE